jgi:hypothetical protein
MADWFGLTKRVWNAAAAYDRSVYLCSKGNVLLAIGLSCLNFPWLRSFTTGMIASIKEFASKFGFPVSANQELRKHREIFVLSSRRS